MTAVVGRHLGSQTSPPSADVISRAAWVALVVAGSMSLVVGLAVTAMNIALPSIERDFHGTSRATLSWGITGYSITVASLILVGGRLADRIGRRRVFRAGVALFTVASICLALAPTAWVFLGSRVGQGVGAAMLSPSALTLVLPLFPAARQMTAIGAWTALSNLGSAIGPSLAAVVTQQLSWRWIFVVPLVVCVPALVLAPRLLPEGAPSKQSPGPIDMIGVAFGTVAVGLLAFTIVHGPAAGWASRVVVACALGVVGTVTIFVWRSLHHPEPLLDLGLFRHRTVWAANLANVFLAAAGLSIWLVYPLFLVQHWHYSLLRTGLAITPVPLASAVTSLFAGRLSEQIGERRVIAYGAVVPLLGAAWLTWRLGPEVAYVRDMLPGALLFSAGFGLVFSPLTAAAMKGVSIAQLGQANAVFNALRSLAGGLGVAVVVAFLGNEAVIPVEAFHRAVLSVAAMTLIGWLVIAACYPRAADREASVRS